jgi:aminoglycoside phosphotransferase (APT) family kinase protein
MTPDGLASADPHARPGISGDVPGQAGGAEPAEPGPLLAAGLAADIYAVSEQQVLRRYRSGQDASPEVDVMRHVAAHGFPVPEVEHLGGPDLLMERLHGPTLLQAIVAGVVTMSSGARTLADLHRQLHAIPAPGGGVVLHLDLHPANVVLTEARGPVLIDWANARGGEPALDVAMTTLIIAEVAVDAGGDYSHGARALLAAFLAVAGEDPLSALDEAVEIRRHDPALVNGECDLVEPAAALVRTFVGLTRG